MGAVTTTDNSAPALKVKLLPTAGLLPYAKNSRTHSADQLERLAASIKQFGFTNPVLIDDSGTIIAGHARVLAAQQLGLEKVPTIKLGHLTPDQARAYVIADNRLAELAGWDSDLLTSELTALSEAGFDLPAIGFSNDEITALLANPTPAPGAGTSGTSEGSPVIQYNIVFESESQQEIWYRFLRWLKSNYTDQETIAGRLAAFIEDAQHVEG